VKRAKKGVKSKSVRQRGGRNGTPGPNSEVAIQKPWLGEKECRRGEEITGVNSRKGKE